LTDDGRMNRFVAILLYGVVALHLGAFLSLAAVYCAHLAGLFADGYDGIMVGVGVMGALTGMGAALVFIAVMVYQRCKE